MSSHPTSAAAESAAGTKTLFPNLLQWTLGGAILQIAMVVAGHFNEFIKNNVFAIGGMAISLIFGALFARAAARSKGGALLGGLMVGGASALLGISVSVLFGDTDASILAFGTAGSAVAGLIGGITLYAIAGSKRR